MGAVALVHDSEWVQRHANQTASDRERFAALLKSRGFQPLKSEANFLFVPTRTPNLLASHLSNKGMTVRPLKDLTMVGSGVRISIGPWSIMQHVADEMGRWQDGLNCRIE